MSDFLLMLIAGVVIGAIGVLFGGSSFLAIPVFQLFYPGFSYAQIMGNIRVGSLGRSFSSTISTFKHIEFKRLLPIFIPFAITSIVGVFLISKLEQDHLVYAIIAAILLTELSPKLAHLVNEKTRIVASALLGLYYGLIGAGSGLLIFALLRTVYTEKTDIAHAKIQARFIETIGVVLVLIVHLLNGDLIMDAFLPWTIGSVFGGVLGAVVLKRFKRASAGVQHVYLWIVYVLALLPFILRWIRG